MLMACIDILMMHGLHSVAKTMQINVLVVKSGQIAI